MASTATTRGRLEKQASGENENTWGDKTNTNFDNIDEWIGGYIAISVAGSTDVTLTATDFTSNQSRQRNIALTGTLTGNINVIVPTAEGDWFFFNSTTGSYTLTVKTSAGTGVSIPQGFWMNLYCDGTNVVEKTPYAVTRLRATTLELGDSSDTTIARSSAGRLTVEGNAIYSAGGTDVALADGGHGSSTAAGARAAFGTVGWDLVEEASANGSAALSFTTNLDNTSDQYVLVITDLTPANDGDALHLRLSENAGGAWQADATDYAWHGARIVGGAVGVVTDESDAQIVLTVTGVGSASGEGVHGRVYLQQRGGGAQFPLINWELAATGTGGIVRPEWGAGQYLTAAEVNGIQVYFSTGNIATGRAALYRIRRS